MNLGFHTGEEDFNASMSVLSIYHQELMDNFKFYASLQEQKFQKEENTMICLQEFVHFEKLMDIARSKEEATAAQECMHEIDGVIIPFADTLNIMNGLNYAQFLEAILRIAYYKKENSEQAGNPEGFKNTLESMFADADLDIKKKSKNDPIVANMMQLGQEGVFEEHFDILAAIFSEKGMLKGDHLELSKHDFIMLLKDSGILIIQKAADQEKQKKQAEEAKKKDDENKEPARKFDENDAADAIQNTHLFDEDQLGYVDFLEALVRIAAAYPFTDEELQGDIRSFGVKILFLIQKLEDKFKALKDTFHSKLDMQYQPRVVVDEDDEDEADFE